MLCGISGRFQSLFHSERQVTHALLTRPPLSHIIFHPKNQESSFVRLACVKHAASVRPEPGSNSLKIISKRLSVQIIFRALNSLIFVIADFFFRFRNFTVRFYIFCKTLLKNLRVPCFYRCLILKVHRCLNRHFRVSLADSSAILPHPPPFVNTFFKLFLSFLPYFSSLPCVPT